MPVQASKAVATLRGATDDAALQGNGATLLGALVIGGADGAAAVLEAEGERIADASTLLTGRPASRRRSHSQIFVVGCAS